MSSSTFVKRWGKANSIGYIAVLAVFAGFGIYAVAVMMSQLGFMETMNQIGFVAVIFLGFGALWEGVRAIRHRGVPPRWWVTPVVCLVVPLLLLGAVAASAPPTGSLVFYAVVLVMASTAFQKFRESRVDMTAA